MILRIPEDMQKILAEGLLFEFLPGSSERYDRDTERGYVMDDIIKDFHDLTEIPPFQQMIPDKKYMDTEEYLDVLQMNIGRKCNLICKHCHVNAGPRGQKRCQER